VCIHTETKNVIVFTADTRIVYLLFINMFSFFGHALNRVFDDQRLMIASVWVWLAIVLVIFSQMGLFHSEFVRFGPSPTTTYVGITLDTWEKWSAVAIFSAISSFMNDMANESLEPFFLCVIRDVKGRYIPFSKMTCVLLTQAWTVYASIMSLFALYTFFSQADFVIIKLIVGLLVNMYSTMRYLRNKKHEPVKFAQYFQHQDVDPVDDQTNMNEVSTTDVEITALKSKPVQHPSPLDPVMVKIDRAEDNINELIAKHTNFEKKSPYMPNDDGSLHGPTP